MAVFVWLEEGMQVKEEWRSAAMECGGLSGVEDGTATMLWWFADNLDSINHTQVWHVQCISYIASKIKHIIAGIEVYRNNYFGAGSGPILFTYLNCGGGESSLYGCSTYSSYTFGARHSDDAGVKCQGTTATSKYNHLLFIATKLN